MQCAAPALVQHITQLVAGRFKPLFQHIEVGLSASNTSEKVKLNIKTPLSSVNTRDLKLKY